MILSCKYVIVVDVTTKEKKLDWGRWVSKVEFQITFKPEISLFYFHLNRLHPLAQDTITQ